MSENKDAFLAASGIWNGSSRQICFSIPARAGGAAQLPPSRGMLTVTLLGCERLQAEGELKTHYFTVSILPAEPQDLPIPGEGATPTCESEVELYFDLEAQHMLESRLTLELKTASGDIAGEGHKDLANAPVGKVWKLDQWVNLVDAHELTCGALHLEIRWTPGKAARAPDLPAEQPEPATDLATEKSTANLVRRLVMDAVVPNYSLECVRELAQLARRRELDTELLAQCALQSTQTEGGWVAAVVSQTLENVPTRAGTESLLIVLGTLSASLSTHALFANSSGAIEYAITQIPPRRRDASDDDFCESTDGSDAASTLESLAVSMLANLSYPEEQEQVRVRPPPCSYQRGARRH